MGEVYRARDAKLNRDVAIKVLPAMVGQDAERLSRFRREAQTLASLNHPNIAAIYGLDEADGKLFLVLELVEGEELAERLKRGAIPLDEALEIAKQIALALEEAHDKGIVHRDLKPANVKLTPDGKVKVLDFGLAKAYSSDASGAASFDSGNSPTMTHAATMAGMILGTAAYMSPEQARGKPRQARGHLGVRRRAHEMLTGGKLFDGETVSDTLAAVLTRDMDQATLPGSMPASLRGLLRRCLERNARNRLHDIADARIVIDEVLAGRHDEPAVAGVQAGALPQSSRGRWLFVAGALVAGVLLGAVIAAAWSKRAGDGADPHCLVRVAPPKERAWCAGSPFLRTGARSRSRRGVPTVASRSGCDRSMRWSRVSYRKRMAHASRSGPPTVAVSATSARRV
jgi:serine/threonine-protein kinase